MEAALQDAGSAMPADSCEPLPCLLFVASKPQNPRWKQLSKMRALPCRLTPVSPLPCLLFVARKPYMNRDNCCPVLLLSLRPLVNRKRWMGMIVKSCAAPGHVTKCGQGTLEMDGDDCEVLCCSWPCDRLLPRDRRDGLG
jgi:hypothetical protein